MAHDDAADRSPVFGARPGDIEAFGRLCEEHRARLLQIALAEAGGAEDPRDIVQESFAAALAAIGALREPARVGHWLAGIVRNQARMRRRAAARRATVGLDEALPPQAAEYWERCSALELAQGLQQAISLLPEPRGTALRRHYWDGRGLAQIAAELGVAEGTVKRWLHESRRAIRQEMIRMGTAPEGIEHSRLAALFSRSADWEHLAGVREALVRADCDLVVNPDPIPDEVAFAVVDYGIEGGKGVEWLVYLLATKAARPVALLGPADQRVVYAAWAAGAEIYLTVPFSVDELAHFANVVLDSKAKEA